MTGTGFKTIRIAPALLSLFVMTLFSASVKAQAVNEETNWRVDNLKKTAANLRKAYSDRDLLKITDLFNRQDVEDVGGYDAFVDFLDLGGSASLKTTATFGEPRELLLVNDKWLSVIPFRMETREARILRITKTCLIGISSDDGKTWRFKTGESFFKDYPELVGQIQIIERKQTVENIEQ